MAEELDYSNVVAELRTNFEAGVIKSLDARLKQLNQLNLMLEENEEEIMAALHRDLHKSKMDALFSEIYLMYVEIRSCINSLEGWMKAERVPGDTLNKKNMCEIQRDPLGVILIIAAWNYPCALAIQPLVGALAAGNCAILKPSELAVHTAFLLTKLLSKYLDCNCVKVVNGGVPETTALLRCRFDHIMYTGGSAVGKVIMRAAAEHLTPVTLELGGKCPTIVDTTCDFDIAAQRITWGKFMNNGQTCIGVDYVMCIGGCQDKLLAALKKAVLKFYGENPQTSHCYGRIINKRHFQRICNLIDDRKVVMGNVTDEEDLYISPTIMTNITSNDRVMSEEIFGPILPIMNFGTLQDAITFIRRREKPLAIYCFSKDATVIELVKKQTSSGGMTINDTLLHYAVATLPFGGVGHSGMGAYHGKHSFECFSHKKSILQAKQALESLNAARYPPYDASPKMYAFVRWIVLPSIKKGVKFSTIFLFCFLMLAISITLPYLKSYFL